MEKIRMIETHPFGSFAPSNSEYLILGSFTGRQAVKGKTFTDVNYDFFYGVARNQFWPILEDVYERELKDTQSKKNLLTEQRIAMADIIYQCERKDSNNLDANLTNIIYAIEEITQILEKHQIRRIFFTSRFVEKKFRTVFKDIILRYPGIELITLPSPSPRYVLMTREEKVKKYKDLLPPKSA